MIASLTQAQTHMRPMRAADLAAVYRLEQACQPVPWPRWCFRSLLRKGAAAWVLEEAGEIIGFGMLSFVRDRAHLLNLCIAPAYRHRGLGRRMMLQMLRVAKQHHCRQAWLEVRPTNRTAIGLYHRLGFRKKLIRKAYYQSRRGRQNAVVMSRPLHALMDRACSRH